MKYHIKLSGIYGMGDTLCLLSACREFIHRTGNTIYVSEAADMIAAYNSEYLRYGNEGADWILTLPYGGVWQPQHGCYVPFDVQRQLYRNYLGYYYAAMGLLDDRVPKLEMPVLEKCDSLILLQPYANYAVNPPDEYIQGVVDICRHITGMGVYIIGAENTPRRLQRVNYDLLKNDGVHLMRFVQSARLVLTPRSFTANVAAGYNKSTFIWCYDDGLNWQLDYTDWNYISSFWKDGLVTAEMKIVELLKK
jgi:hypothetical protein